MSSVGPSPEALDRIAVEAMTEVKSGMFLGLGTGRAAEAFIRRLGEASKGGLDVRCITTSIRSQKLADELGIPTATLDDVERLDVAFDGADEVTPSLDLTKGLGGALLRERVVASLASRFVILVTPEKRVDKLGTRTPIPIEVVPFAKATIVRAFAKLGGDAKLRENEDGSVYETDNRNYILDTRFAPMDEPAALDAKVRAVPGVVDTGLFLGMADVVLVGTPDGLDRLDR
jgi:ribose 5-phosphate isomerase A